jgi:predicted nucleic acid-binding protein
MKKQKGTVPDNIVRLYRTLRNINSVYIDTCFVGYLTDDEKNIRRGDLITKYFKNYNIKPFYSTLVIEELSAIDLELKDKKLEKMIGLWKKVLNEINATLFEIGKISNEGADFYEFLRNLGISKNDALHFTLTVFKNIDAFVSFNKKIFVNNKNKIDRKLMLLKKKTPLIFQVDELYKNLEKLDRYGFI